MGANNCCREGTRGNVLEREKQTQRGIVKLEIMGEKYILGMIINVWHEQNIGGL